MGSGEALHAEEFAKLQPSKSAISFELRVPHEWLVMTVSGPGTFFYREEFGVGETPAFELAAAAEDGVYTYELRVVPLLDAELREEIAAARAANDNDALRRIEASGRLPRAMVQSGFFSLRDGVFTSDSEKGAGTRRTR